MATVTFDTLKFVETLKEAGVPEPQAKAFSTAVQESHEAADLATKTDLRHEMKELGTGLRHEIKELETGLRHDIKELEIGLRHEIGDLRKDTDVKLVNLKFELIKWLIGIAIAQTALLIGLLKFFPVGS